MRRVTGRFTAQTGQNPSLKRFKQGIRTTKSLPWQYPIAVLTSKKRAAGKITPFCSTLLGPEFRTPDLGGGWATYTIPDVTIKRGDEIAAEAWADGTHILRLDYLQLDSLSRAVTLPRTSERL